MTTQSASQSLVSRPETAQRATAAAPGGARVRRAHGTTSVRMDGVGADVDRRAGIVTVRRTVVDGVVKPYGKTTRSLRAVPLPARADQALEEHPIRIDTRLVFPGVRGGFLALSPFRHRDWNPALRAAGLPHRSVYALRHTYASMSIAAGVSLFELSRFMGTSPAMLDKTYGHMLPDALDRAKIALDSFVGTFEEPLSDIEGIQ